MKTFEFNAPSIGKADEKQLKMSLEKIHQFRPVQSLPS